MILQSGLKRGGVGPKETVSRVNLPTLKKLGGGQMISYKSIKHLKTRYFSFFSNYS